jgi:hypothetical protein
MSNINTMLKSRVMGYDERVACIGSNLSAYKMLAGKSEGKIPFGGRQEHIETDHKRT